MANVPRIGFFDSGIGGMSVLSACLKLCPEGEYYYYGDNLRAPYGERSAAEIAAFTEEGLGELAAAGVDAAVIACNTASAVCLERMRTRFPFPVVGMEPALAPAAEVCSDVVVLATPVTAASDRLRALIDRFPSVNFRVYPAPALAAAIEAHFLRGVPLDLSAHLPAWKGFDGAVLGCTHYSLVRSEIAHFLGVPVFDGAEGTARRALEVAKAGTGDHLKPQAFPNNCLSSKCIKSAKKGVFFLGGGCGLNKNLFDLNICFKIF